MIGLRYLLLRVSIVMIISMLVVLTAMISMSPSVTHVTYASHVGGLSAALYRLTQ